MLANDGAADQSCCSPGGPFSPLYLVSPVTDVFCMKFESTAGYTMPKWFLALLVRRQYEVAEP